MCHAYDRRLAPPAARDPPGPPPPGRPALGSRRRLGVRNRPETALEQGAFGSKGISVGGPKGSPTRAARSSAVCRGKARFTPGHGFNFVHSSKPGLNFAHSIKPGFNFARSIKPGLSFANSIKPAAS